MAALHRSTSASSYSSCKGAEVAVSDTFPVGLRVLVVDDDHTCLKILEHMLRRCLYHVTTCSQASVALKLLRERKGCFDIVLSDVHMPDMDGYKLLELIGLEMDLPVIMMSGDGRVCAVMRGIRHGACDYLIKPVREEELKNIWQHVVRKRFNGNKELEHSGSFDDNDRDKRSDDVDYASSANEGLEGTLKVQKKRSSTKEDDDVELDNDDPSTSKKPRVVWSVELHQQFVSAVNQLGIDKAVPKRILELMNVPGLTRENVASHLQKFRLYLKRLSGVAQQAAMSNPFNGPIEANIKLGSIGRFDIQSLAASGQIPPQTLAALHAELLGRPTGSLVAAVDQPALLQASLQGPKCIPADHGVAFGQPLLKCQSNVTKQYPQHLISVGDASNFVVWPSNAVGTVAPIDGHAGMNSQNSNMMMDALHKQQKLQQQQKQHHPQPPQQCIPAESSRSINVQPSRLVAPSRSSAIFQDENSLVNQNCSFSRSPSRLPGQSNNFSFNGGQMSDGDGKNTGVLCGYSTLCSISPSTSSCSVNAENSMGQQVQKMTVTYEASGQLLGPLHSFADVQNSIGTKSNEVNDQISLTNVGFISKETCFPSQLAGDEFESQMNNLNGGKISLDSSSNRVKHEPGMEIMDSTKVGIPVFQQYTSSDLMSVFME